MEKTSTSYRSRNINLTVTAYSHSDVDFYVADFYIRDISCMKNVFAKDEFGKGIYEDIRKVAARSNAIVTVNGDYYGLRKDGVIARNGVLYYSDDNPLRDMCILYWDGTMKTVDAGPFDAKAEMENGIYQIWNFGPGLLDENGEPKEEYNTDVNKSNPRTAIGYFEPGHYCFVTVDGRNGKTDGVSIRKLAVLMNMLGCKEAYNLDGGRTSQLYYDGEMVNVPCEGGRYVSDYIILVESEEN